MKHVAGKENTSITHTKILKKQPRKVFHYPPQKVGVQITQLVNDTYTYRFLMLAASLFSNQVPQKQCYLIVLPFLNHHHHHHHLQYPNFSLTTHVSPCFKTPPPPSKTSTKYTPISSKPALLITQLLPHVSSPSVHLHLATLTMPTNCSPECLTQIFILGTPL